MVADNTLSVIGGSTRTVMATVPVGSKEPKQAAMDGVAVDPGTRTVYVANLEKNTVLGDRAASAQLADTAIPLMRAAVDHVFREGRLLALGTPATTVT